MMPFRNLLWDDPRKWYVW